MRRLAALLVVATLVVAGWIAWRLQDRPALDDRPRLASSTAAGPEVAVRFLGVTSLIIDDGTTTLVVDGFVSRPPLWRTIVGRIAPDPDVVAWALDRVGLVRADAVFTVHSHYDHAMDAPLVAARTGALLVGSSSTANIARGLRLPERQIRVVVPGEPMRFGAFEVVLLESQHFPHGMAMGEVAEPLVPPARATAWREGGSYSILVRHELGTLLVQGSAGWKDGALAGRQADVALLGLAGLGTRDASYTDRYLQEVVDAVGAALVIPIHWDDFTRPLREPLVAMPRLLDDVTEPLDRITAHLTARGKRLAFLPAFERIRLLPPP